MTRRLDGAPPLFVYPDITNEGRQREAEEFRQHFEQSGFRFERVVALSSPNSILEATAV